MTIRGFCVLTAAGALALTAVSASAQTPEIEFFVEGDGFAVAVPDGFCEPTGEDAETATQYATGDTRNVTPVDLQRCGTFEQDYMLIKSPRDLDPVAVSKAEFIEGLTAELAKQEQIVGGEKRGSTDMLDENEGDRELEIISFGSSGSDDQCAYLGGQLIVTFSDGRKEPVFVGSCGTLVGNRHLFVHSYARVESGATIESLKARSRALSETIETR